MRSLTKNNGIHSVIKNNTNAEFQKEQDNA